jgi:hypothetical protein
LDVCAHCLEARVLVAELVGAGSLCRHDRPH